MFVGACHATGLANVLAMVAFLDNVVYEPIRLGAVKWPVAFECLIIYLRMLEAQSGDTYTLSNIFTRSGGIDATRAEATLVATDLYPAVFLRTHGANSSDNGRDRDGGRDPGKGMVDHVFKGELVGDTPSSKVFCAAFNLGTPHYSKNVDANGRCKFRHVCDQFVADKGPGGRCGGDHARCAGCDYDSAQKVAKAQK